MLAETRVAETTGEETAGGHGTLRTAHDRIISGMETGQPQMLFDTFWREGELALLFGEAGAGKSLLAMQLARTLAVGGDIPWFVMEAAAGKTLYVDLSMNDRQFASRNSYRGRNGKPRVWPISQRLYCDRPEDDNVLIEWLERQISTEKLKYVIIDDLGSIMQTCDGTRETMWASEKEDEWDDDDDDAEDDACPGEIAAAEISSPPMVEACPRTVAIGPMQGPEPCPFMYDKSDAARRWLAFLVSRHQEKAYADVLRAYAAGDEWARPPGSVPPIDPEDPFDGMEVDSDVRGNVKYVVERDVNNKPSLWYAYRPDGRLDRYVMTATGSRSKPANANLFGKFADMGKDVSRTEVSRAKSPG